MTKFVVYFSEFKQFPISLQQGLGPVTPNVGPGPPNVGPGPGPGPKNLQMSGPGPRTGTYAGL